MDLVHVLPTRAPDYGFKGHTGHTTSYRFGPRLTVCHHLARNVHDPSTGCFHCFIKWGLRNRGNSGWHHFLSSKIIADGECSHEIKRHLLLGRKVMTNLNSMLKSRDITLPKNVRLVKAMEKEIPLQYFCLENLRDRGAWWAAVYRVTQSRTRLKRLSSSSSSSQGCGFSSSHVWMWELDYKESWALKN